MTNYNERQDEIIERIRRGMHRELGGTSPHLEAGYTRDEAKQAITSLIKELVKEANPLRPQDGTMIMAQGSYADGIRKFEQNLLKELEEV